MELTPLWAEYKNCSELSFFDYPPQSNYTFPFGSIQFNEMFNVLPL